MEYVKAIFIKQFTPADLWNGERDVHTSQGAGGGGMTYFDVPLGNIGAHKLAAFLGSNIQPEQPWPIMRIMAGVLGDATVPPYPINFGPRQNNERYSITNQNRRIGQRSRHPAWTPKYGFPEISDADAPHVGTPGSLARPQNDLRIPDVSDVKLLILKTVDGVYYASFLATKSMPAAWPKGIGLEKIFATGLTTDMIDFTKPATPLSSKAQEVLDIWGTGKKNVLLYGPPGTGKTHIMQELWQFLNQQDPGRVLSVDPSAPVQTAFSAETKASLPGPIRCDWVTFHQNFSYEQFILALRPAPATNGSGIELKPRAGVLLDAAMSLYDKKAKTAILFIDEINRGNVSRIFGEFITFMDDEYREAADGSMEKALPIPLGMVRHKDERTEPIERMDGALTTLPVPWHFPFPIYIVASMNSVDRAVAPLDTALARRFARVELSPDMRDLAERFHIQNSDSLFQTIPGGPEESELEGEGSEGDGVEAVISNVEASQETTKDPAEVAYLLLYRLNYILAATLGPDFEIGHTYMFRIAQAQTEDDKWFELARIWDQALYPQLRERYNNRLEILSEILRIEPKGLLKPRKKPGALPNAASVRPITDMTALQDAFRNQADKDRVKRVLTRIAGL